MSNTARLQALPRANDAPDPDELRRVAAALVQLDAWCRQRGFDELAALLEAAVDWTDEHLTGR